MNIKEDALNAAATASRAEETTTMAIGEVSADDSITEMVKTKGYIASFLMKGKENALSTETLEKLTGYNERHIRILVSRERLIGIPILASSGTPSGYYLPDDGEKGIYEMKDSYRLARSKAVGLLAAVAPVYKELKRLGAFEHQIPGQEVFDMYFNAEVTEDA